MGNDCIVLNSTWQTKLSGLGQTSQYHKENVYLFLLFLLLFSLSILTVAGSGYYGIEFPLPYTRNLN